MSFVKPPSDYVSIGFEKPQFPEFQVHRLIAFEYRCVWWFWLLCLTNCKFTLQKCVAYLSKRDDNVEKYENYLAMKNVS